MNALKHPSLARTVVSCLWPLTCVCLLACNPARDDKAGTVEAELTGYNHTDKTIGAFYVNGSWGGNVTPGSGGGKFVCCAKLPDPWKPGTTVVVAWQDDKLQMRERVVEVPRYERKSVGTAHVHFLRNGEIKVFVGMFDLGHPDYPLKGADAELKLRQDPAVSR